MPPGKPPMFINGQFDDRDAGAPDYIRRPAPGKKGVAGKAKKGVQQQQEIPSAGDKDSQSH